LEHSSDSQNKVTMMRALVWHGGDRLSIEELAEPETGDGHVVFDVVLAGICGSDLHPYRGHHGPRQPPLVLGHEAVGTVAGLPGRFVLFPLVSCGVCRACVRGDGQLCERRGLVGLDRQGVFAERIAVDAAALVPVPDSLDDRLCALVEPLAASVSALRLERVGRGDTVVILGSGPIGLLGVHAAVLLGARVLAVEPLTHRRELAARLGAGQVFADAAGVPSACADFAIDAVGIEATWRAGIAAVRAGGSVSVVGLGEAEGRIPMGDLVRRGIGVRGHYAYTRADFEAALELLVDAPPPIDWIDVVGLDEAAEGFRRLVEEPDSVTKVLVDVGLSVHQRRDEKTAMEVAP
jgi:threonine dehydrogenase-like Zn-dependent dehydrogenase